MTKAQRFEEPINVDPGTRPRSTNVRPFLMAGIWMVVGGLIGGLAAKAFADRASLAVSSARRLVSDPSNPVVSHIDESSAHYIAPDYTGLWIGVIIAGLGVIVLVAGILVATTKRRVT